MPVDTGGGLTTGSSPLPEPGTLFLLGAGLLAVGFTRRSLLNFIPRPGLSADRKEAGSSRPSADRSAVYPAQL
jgi:hypothetical protein